MKPELMKDASGNENYRIGINHGKWEKVGVLGTFEVFHLRNEVLD